MRSLLIRKTPESAAAVRTRITDDLRAAGLPADLAADAALLATELVGNAIRHGSALADGGLEVEWTANSTGVRLQVSDGGGGDRPALRPADLTDVSGRGLTIVAALADEWGVDERPGRTTVWAHLAAHSSPAPL